MTTKRTTINEILIPFFAARLDGKKGVTRRRIDAVEQQLRDCLEAEAERILVTSDLLLLAAEREFDPVGAVARTMHADDLVFILSIFVKPQWQPTDPIQRRTQLRLTELLTGYLLGRRLVDQDGLCCPLIEIQIGIDHGRAELMSQRLASSAVDSSANGLA